MGADGVLGLREAQGGVDKRQRVRRVGLTSTEKRPVVADDKGKNMTIKINETDLLALLGENGERWVQGQWGIDDKLCLHGAIRRCQPVRGDAFLIEQVAKLEDWGTDWNDDKDTSWSDIRARLAHIEVTDDDLAKTFGPQWKHIVALVRRAAIITSGEVRRLKAAAGVAWYAAGSAAWEAERVKPLYAAWNAARYAARVAAWDAPEFAARDVAGEAAGALAVRDLIGKHEFTQQHYDHVTSAWRTVIGPIHPDDAPMEARRG